MSSSESSQESYLRGIGIKPSEIEFGPTNNPDLKIHVKFFLKQTTFMLLTTYDEDARATRPGLLFQAHRAAQPLEFVPLDPFIFSRNTLIIIARPPRLKDYLGLTPQDEAAIVNEIQRNLIANEGYNNVRSTDEVWPQSVRLEVTLDRISINHICGPPKLRPRFLKTERGEECSICLQELDDTIKPLSRLGCDHVFHQSCIVRWLGSRSIASDDTLSCPLCRGVVPFGELVTSTIKLDVIPSKEVQL